METAVEWLVEQFNLQAYIPHIEQAKEMEDDYAIDFAYWLTDTRNKNVTGSITIEELLEIFKKEKGL